MGKIRELKGIANNLASQLANDLYMEGELYEWLREMPQGAKISIDVISQKSETYFEGDRLKRFCEEALVNVERMMKNIGLEDETLETMEIVLETSPKNREGVKVANRAKSRIVYNGLSLKTRVILGTKGRTFEGESSGRVTIEALEV